MSKEIKEEMRTAACDAELRELTREEEQLLRHGILSVDSDKGMLPKELEEKGRDGRTKAEIIIDMSEKSQASYNLLMKELG